jgi:TetR/AcrR family transcriptional regulator, transcriptional repressor for nem operon
MSQRNPQATNDTKARILDAAEAIMLEKGFNGVGLNEILKSVGVPKGSFYHWFPSKEQFGVELLQHYCAETLDYKKRWLTKKDTLPNALERLVAFMESAVSKLLENDCQQICLIAKLSTEVASWSEPMRQTLAKGFTDVIELYQQVIVEGQAQGSISQQLDAQATAHILHDLWFGAYLRSAICRTVQPCRQAIALVKSYLAP